MDKEPELKFQVTLSDIATVIEAYAKEAIAIDRFEFMGLTLTKDAEMITRLRSFYDVLKASQVTTLDFTQVCQLSVIFSQCPSNYPSVLELKTKMELDDKKVKIINGFFERKDNLEHCIVNFIDFFKLSEKNINGIIAIIQILERANSKLSAKELLAMLGYALPIANICSLLDILEQSKNLDIEFFHSTFERLFFSDSVKFNEIYQKINMGPDLHKGVKQLIDICKNKKLGQLGLYLTINQYDKSSVFDMEKWLKNSLLVEKICDAIRDKDMDEEQQHGAIKEILDANPGINLNDVDKDGTPLSLACELGASKIARLLIDKGANIDCQCNWNEDVALFAVIHQPDKIKELLQLLVDDKKGNINVKSRKGESFLHKIVSNCSLSVVSMVIEHPKLDVPSAELESNSLIAALLEKCSSKGVSMAIVDVCSAKATLLDRSSPKISEEDVLPVVKKLIEKGANINLPRYRDNQKHYRSPLILAIHYQFFQVAKLLLNKECVVDPDGKNTALKLAIFSGNVELVEMFIQKGADITDALQWIARGFIKVEPYPYKGMTELLAKNGANVDVLHFMREFNATNEDMTSFMLREFDGKNYADVNSLHFDCEFDSCSKLEFIKALLEQGANLNMTNEKGEDFFNSFTVKIKEPTKEELKKDREKIELEHLLKKLEIKAEDQKTNESNNSKDEPDEACDQKADEEINSKYESDEEIYKVPSLKRLCVLSFWRNPDAKRLEEAHSRLKVGQTFSEVYVQLPKLPAPTTPAQTSTTTTTLNVTTETSSPSDTHSWNSSRTPGQ